MNKPRGWMDWLALVVYWVLRVAFFGACLLCVVLVLAGIYVETVKHGWWWPIVTIGEVVGWMALGSGSYLLWFWASRKVNR